MKKEKVKKIKAEKPKKVKKVKPAKVKKQKKPKVIRTPEEKRKILLDSVKCALFIFMGTALYSIGIAWFLNPQQTPNGGVSGVAIILGHLLQNVPLFNAIGGIGSLIFILNIPLLILALVKLGTRFSVLTVVSVAMTSLFTIFAESLYPKIGALQNLEPIPGVIIGGMLVGLSVGLVFRARTCLGGSDIIIKVLRQKFKYMKTGTLYLIIDGMVVCAGGIIFQNINNLVYAVIALFIQSKVTDLVLYGQEGAKMIYIITEKEPEIAKRINDEVHSGVTYLRGTGAYTGVEKTVLICALRKQSLPKAKEIVLQEDKNAFMVVTSASQVWGKGYSGLDDTDEL